MVNVTHYAYNRVAGNKIARVVLAVVNKAVFYGHNYLVLNLCADIHGNKGGGVIIYGFVDGNHHALHHKALDNLRGGYFQLERKVTHGDFVRRGDFKLLTALAFHFKFFKLCLLLLLLALLRLALLLGALSKLLLIGVAVGHGGGRSYLLILLVIFVKLDICGAHIHMGGACRKLFRRRKVAGARFALHRLFRLVTMNAVVAVFIKSAAETVIFLEIGFVAEAAALLAVALRLVAEASALLTVALGLVTETVALLTVALGLVAETAALLTVIVLRSVAALLLVYGFIRRLLLRLGRGFLRGLLLRLWCGFLRGLLLHLGCGFLRGLLLRLGCGFLRGLFLCLGRGFFRRLFLCLGRSLLLFFSFFCFFFLRLGIFGLFLGLICHSKIRRKACYFFFLRIMLKDIVQLLFRKNCLRLFCRKFFA